MATNVCDHLDDTVEDVRPTFFSEVDEFLDLLAFGFVDYELVSFLHVGIDLFGEFCVFEECVTDLYEAVVLILGFLVFPKKLGNIFIGLYVFRFEFFEPFLGLLDVDLLHEGIKLQYNN